jgi:hypothetical protein
MGINIILLNFILKINKNLTKMKIKDNPISFMNFVINFYHF